MFDELSVRQINVLLVWVLCAPFISYSFTREQWCSKKGYYWGMSSAVSAVSGNTWANYVIPHTVKRPIMAMYSTCDVTTAEIRNVTVLKKSWFHWYKRFPNQGINYLYSKHLCFHHNIKGITNQITVWIIMTFILCRNIVWRQCEVLLLTNGVAMSSLTHCTLLKLSHS